MRLRFRKSVLRDMGGQTTGVLAMTDTEISPSSRDSWVITEKSNGQKIGRICHKGGKIGIEALTGAILEGIRNEPYESKQAAIDAVAHYTRGVCLMNISSR